MHFVTRFIELLSTVIITESLQVVLPSTAELYTCHIVLAHIDVATCYNVKLDLSSIIHRYQEPQMYFLHA